MNKIHIFVGHYGSGKTNVAVNFALELRNIVDLEISLVDLDIVNPYFRAADNKALLNQNGIKTILPCYANTNVDIPTPPIEIKSVFDSDCYSVFDVGGDDDGAIVLSVYKEQIISQGYDMYFVYNSYRPLTSDPFDAFLLMKRIEEVSGLKFSGIINNSNLGVETTVEVVNESIPKVNELSTLSGCSVLFTTIMDHIDKSKLPNEQKFKIIKNVTKQLF